MGTLPVTTSGWRACNVRLEARTLTPPAPADTAPIVIKAKVGRIRFHLDLSRRHRQFRTDLCQNLQSHRIHR